MGTRLQGRCNRAAQARQRPWAAQLCMGTHSVRQEGGMLRVGGGVRGGEVVRCLRAPGLRIASAGV